MSGKESGGYKSVLANIDTISSHLRANNAVKEALIMKFKKHRWLDPIATLDEMGLVKLVLDRISNDDSQYDIFVKMLRDTVGTDLIVEKLTDSELNTPPTKRLKTDTPRAASAMYTTDQETPQPVSPQQGPSLTAKQLKTDSTESIQPSSSALGIVHEPMTTAHQLMKVEAAHFPDSNVAPLEVQLPCISGIMSSPRCPSPRKHFATTAHNGMAYYANIQGIHEFDVHKRKWTKKIPCQQALFGMAVIEDELTIVGGVIVKDLKSGESEETVETNKVACWPLSASSKQKSWHEKYPAIGTRRICPQLVVAGRYLIALGGFTEMNNEIRNPTTSVEILDLEEKRWYSNDLISLPQVFTTMIWQSACICNNDLFIAVEHDDPEYDDMKEDLIEMESTDSYGGHNPELDEMLPEPYPCFSMYCCSVETLVQMAKDQFNDGYCWQELSHPHPSVYRNPFNIPPVVLRMPPPEMDYDEDDIEYCHQTDFFHYGKCCFTLSCIKNNILIAVGCKHVESNTKDDIQSSLYSAYISYRSISRIENCFQDDMHICDKRRSSEECYIHFYDIEKDSWKLIGSILDNGAHDSQPSVAVVGNKIIFTRNSETVRICTIE